MTSNSPLLSQLAAASRRAARAAYAALPGKQVVFERLRGRLPEHVFQHLHFHGEVNIALAPGKSIRMRHYGYSIENRLFWRGIDAGFEPATLAIWRTLAPHARGVLDIGANTGVFALVARALSSEARVVAVEPVARIFEKLVANVGRNDMDVVCICEAISDTVGVGTFVDPGSEHLYTVVIEQQTAQAPETPSRGHRRSVALTTVDALVERLALDNVDLVKLDVESHEPAALRGAEKTLKHLRPTLLVEIWNDGVGEAVDAILRPVGYSAYKISDRERLLTLCATTRTERTSNFLFVPSEQRELVESRLRSKAPIPLTFVG